MYFDADSVVIRRSDADDTDAIINLVEIGEDDIYNRVYSYPKILKLIETSYLAITVIDRETGVVIGFAAFEDFPQVSKFFYAHLLRFNWFVSGPWKQPDSVVTLAVTLMYSANFLLTLLCLGPTWNDRR